MMNKATSEKRKRLLFVAYQFPPAGGIGVHRVLKFVKYLPQLGWDCSVLTVSNPSVPITDNSHHQDIPPGTTIVRAKTWEPGYGWKKSVSASSGATATKSASWKSFLKQSLRSGVNTLFQPDLQILWAPQAIAAGRKLLREQRHDAIIATAPPFSSFYVGEQLAKKSGLPLFLDYRDEWGISNAHWENKQPSRWAEHQQVKLQRRILSHATAAIATTPSSCESIAETARQGGLNTPCHYIYNGYDPDDFPVISESQRPDFGNGTKRFRLSYVGTLWNLNSIEPIVKAVQLLQQQHPQLLTSLELVIAGRKTAQQEQLLATLQQCHCPVVLLPFISHAEATQLMQTSDALLLLNSDLPGAERIVNGKLFEYFASQKPFLLVSPVGDMWQLTNNCPSAYRFEPGCTNLIAQQLAQLLEQHRLGIKPVLTADWNPEMHTRHHRAEQLVQLISQYLEVSPIPLSTVAVNSAFPLQNVN